MWREFSIQASSERQRESIRHLKGWIQDLEVRNLVQGFAFNHYSRADRNDELRVRFDYSNEEHLNTIRDELRSKLSEIGRRGDFRENDWEAPEHVLRAYELGSRCAFLLWELIDRGRASEDYFSTLLEITDNQFRLIDIPLQFQWCFNHGVMNSIGVKKQPNEQVVHLLALMESTGSSNAEELCRRILAHPIMSRIRR